MSRNRKKIKSNISELLNRIEEKQTKEEKQNIFFQWNSQKKDDELAETGLVIDIDRFEFKEGNIDPAYYEVELKKPIINGVWKYRFSGLLYNLIGLIIIYIFLKYFNK